MKTARIRPLADADLDDALEWLDREDPALLDALQSGLQHLSAHPAIGSRRYSHLLPGGELRCWPLGRFPYLVFYLERADHLDVLRLLHQGRDIAGELDGIEGSAL